jgi:hypothetical protein
VRALAACLKVLEVYSGVVGESGEIGLQLPWDRRHMLWIFGWMTVGGRDGWAFGQLQRAWNWIQFRSR